MNRVRFRLRTLFLLILVAAIVLAIVNYYLSAAPDIVITKIRFYPANPDPNQTVGVLITVSNVGRRDAVDFDIHQSENTGTSHSGVGHGLGKIFLKPGESLDYHWGATKFHPDQNQTLKFRVDSENVVKESNEENNLYEIEYCVRDAINLDDIETGKPGVPYRK